jgi:peptidoglycan/xylan/chitin deacetylase (PgdA/CDA1 family)
MINNRIAEVSEWTRYLCELKSQVRLDSDKKKIAILMYHGITEEPSRDWGPQKYDMTKSKFKKDMKYLLRKFTPISMDELLAWLNGKEVIPEYSFIVTFDDALQSQFKNALPVLESLNVPATVYVPTAIINDEFPLFERVLSHEIKMLDIKNTKRIYNKLYQNLRYEQRESRKVIVDRLISDDNQLPLHMTQEQLQYLDSHPLISLGAHSHNHTLLTEHSKGSLTRDIQMCKQTLDEIITSNVVHFSYPYGDFNSDVAEIVESNGFKTASTTSPRIIKYKKCENKFTIPRIDGATQFDEWFRNE